VSNPKDTMAHVDVEADTVIVRLSPWERLGAMHGDIRVPRDAVTDARVAADPWTELRGIRSPGTGIPGVIALGTRRGRFGKDFAAVYRHRPGVVIECTDTSFQRLILTVENPEALATALTVGATPT
jgi:hypothetical protein